MPSDLDSSIITQELYSLKNRISAEYTAISVANNNWPNDIITSGKNDTPSTTTTRLGSSYDFITDFASFAKSYPAILRSFLKPV